jgi:hypothetical protein
MKTVYELRRYKNSDSQGYAEALKLYSENIESVYRTDTNEIIFWTDNFKKRFGDSFFILGLYLNDVLIGFSELAYFQEEKIVMIDYIVIDKPYRKNSSFYQFSDKILTFLSDENIEFNYIVCEVGCYFDNLEPAESSKLFIRLLKMAHFGVIKCAYYVPQLGKRNYESQMRAMLMIYTNDEVKQIKKETYLNIIETLFYKYYQRWYDEFFNEEEKKEYKKNLDELFENIKKDLAKKKVIEINGYHNLLPLAPIDYGETKAKKAIKIISFIVIFITSISCFGFLALFIQNKYKIDISNQTAIFSLGVVAASIITSLIFGNKSNILTKMVEKFIDN